MTAALDFKIAVRTNAIIGGKSHLERAAQPPAVGRHNGQAGPQLRPGNRA